MKVYLVKSAYLEPAADGFTNTLVVATSERNAVVKAAMGHVASKNKWFGNGARIQRLKSFLKAYVYEHPTTDELLEACGLEVVNETQDFIQVEWPALSPLTPGATYIQMFSDVGLRYVSSTHTGAVFSKGVKQCHTHG